MDQKHPITFQATSDYIDLLIKHLAELYQYDESFVIEFAILNWHESEHITLHKRITAGELMACPWCGGTKE